MGTPALGGGQPDPLSGIQRWPRIVATEMAAARRSRWRAASYVSERAELRGEKSFHVFVLPGAGSQHAQFDPSAWTYRPANAGTYTDEGMGPLMAAAHPTLSRWRTIHGFDALLVLTGSKASANL